MATKAKSFKKTPDILDEVQKGDFTDLLKHVSGYPLWYGAAAVFVIVCVAAGMYVRSIQSDIKAEQVSALAKALQTEDAKARASELALLADGKKDVSAQALYLMGQSYVEANEYANAKEAFERFRNEYPASEYLPDVVEGLGLIAEQNKDYTAAIGFYKEIVDKWPSSLARRRQYINLGRAEELSGNLPNAVKQYQAQLEQYPENPQQAQAAIDRLKSSHPELFPKPEASAEAAAPAEAGSEPAVQE